MSMQITEKNFKQEVLESDKPVLIDFWASWCAPCRMLSPVIDEIAEEKGEEVKVCKINVDEEPSLAQKYNVMSIPTLIVIKNGKVINVSVGVKSKQSIEKMILG